MTPPEQLLQKYRNKGILVDANLLVGYLIGSMDRRHLRDCRATKSFRVEDFDLLNAFLSRFKLLVTTPHILTEVSNLAGKLPANLHTEFRMFFRVAIEQLNEIDRSAKDVARDDTFLRFGLTDTAITQVAPGKHLVLTAEFALYGLLNKRGVDVINFNHLRPINWD